jgi:hypothetical protein
VMPLAPLGTRPAAPVPWVLLLTRLCNPHRCLRTC